MLQRLIVIAATVLIAAAAIVIFTGLHHRSHSGMGAYAAAGVAVDEYGNVYTTDSRRHQVVKLSPDGNIITAWPYKNLHFAPAPTSIAVDSSGVVYLLDEAGSILRVSPSGAALVPWVRKPLWEKGRHLAIDTHGNVYVYDNGRDRIVRLSKAGKLLDYLGALGNDAGRLPAIGGIAVGDRGNILATTTDHADRVLRLTPTGTLRNEWRRNGNGSANLNIPTGITYDVLGDIYVAENNGFVNRYTSAGDPLARWKTASSAGAIAVDPSDNVYVADQEKGHIVRVSPAGKVTAVWG